MTDDQAKEAIALLRSIHADIEAMRHDDGFGGFDPIMWEYEDKVVIDWPNLSILSVKIGEYLDSLREQYGSGCKA
jgi:hypothetical protein